MTMVSFLAIHGGWGVPPQTPRVLRNKSLKMWASPNPLPLEFAENLQRMESHRRESGDALFDAHAREAVAIACRVLRRLHALRREPTVRREMHVAFAPSGFEQRGLGRLLARQQFRFDLERFLEEAATP